VAKENREPFLAAVQPDENPILESDFYFWPLYK